MTYLQGECSHRRAEEENEEKEEKEEEEEEEEEEQQKDEEEIQRRSSLECLFSTAPCLLDDLVVGVLRGPVPRVALRAAPHHRAPGALRISYRTEVGRARITTGHLQGEFSCRRRAEKVCRNISSS